MILHKLGRFFLMALEHVWDGIRRGAEYLCFVSSGSRVKLAAEDRISEMPLLLAIGSYSFCIQSFRGCIRMDVSMCCHISTIRKRLGLFQKFLFFLLLTDNNRLWLVSFFIHFILNFALYYKLR